MISGFDLWVGNFFSFWNTPKIMSLPVSIVSPSVCHTKTLYETTKIPCGASKTQHSEKLKKKEKKRKWDSALPVPYPNPSMDSKLYIDQPLTTSLTSSSVILPFVSLAKNAKSLQLCPSLRPHRRQPTGVLHLQASPGKNTGVGCHFSFLILTLNTFSLVTNLTTVLIAFRSLLKHHFGRDTAWTTLYKLLILLFWYLICLFCYLSALTLI